MGVMVLFYNCNRYLLKLTVFFRQFLPVISVIAVLGQKYFAYVSVYKR
jgi:uncharacterized membrane protein YfbV (UPF0208 family)